MEMFEEATRLKLRWSYRGVLSVEDLWDLSVEQLDEIYKGLAQEAKASQEESLLTEHRRDHKLVLRTDIVKHIVTVKLAEAEKAAQAAERKAAKERLTEILALKQEQQLLELSPEELEAKIAAL